MKRFICIILSITLLSSVMLTASAYHLWPGSDLDEPYVTVTSDDAIAKYEAQTGETVETHRYYFQMPDGVHGIRDEEGHVCESWYNEHSQGAGVYWWGNEPAACESWTGYRAMIEDAEQGICYANVPASVSDLIWNNGVDGGQDRNQPIFQKVQLSDVIPCEYPAPDEYDTMPEGADSFDNCIFIPDPNKTIWTAELIIPKPVNGSWYFYYGGGCYGNYATDSAHFVSAAQNCCNPDHFDASGKHIGYTGVRRGDYDSDNNITILDATRVQRIIAGLFTGSNPAILKSADADGDKELTILDATRIQRVIAGLCGWDGTPDPDKDPYELPIIFK